MLVVVVVVVLLLLLLLLLKVVYREQKRVFCFVSFSQIILVIKMGLSVIDGWPNAFISTKSYEPAKGCRRGQKGRHWKRVHSYNKSKRTRTLHALVTMSSAIVDSRAWSKSSHGLFGTTLVVGKHLR